MIPGIQTGLIAVVFASQIFVLSFFTPGMRRHFLALMIVRYPPQEYPRLYPIPRERMQRRLALFKPLHWFIGVCSAIALLVGLLHGTPALQLARSMLTCLLLQLLPHYAAIPAVLKQMKELRAMPPPSIRTVELRQWRIVDFLSPLPIALGLLGQALALGCCLVAYRHRPQGTPLVVYCAVVSAALLLRMLYLLFTPIAFKRADRYMSAGDMFRIRRRRLRALFGGGAALGAYFALALLNSAQLIRFDMGYMIIGLSIVMQLLGLYIVVMQRQDLETRDFSVYRGERPLQQAS